MVLTLPEQPAALQRPVPVIAAAPSKQEGAAKPAKKPIRSARRSRPAASASAKTPSRPVHVIPRVEYSEQGHYVVPVPSAACYPLSQTQKRGLPGWQNRTRFALWEKGPLHGPS